MASAFLYTIYIDASCHMIDSICSISETKTNIIDTARFNCTVEQKTEKKLRPQSRATRHEQRTNGRRSKKHTVSLTNYKKIYTKTFVALKVQSILLGTI